MRLIAMKHFNRLTALIYIYIYTGVKAKKNPEPELFCVCGRGGRVPWHGHIRRNKQTNKQTNNPRGNTHFWTDEQTRFMLNQLLLLLVVVKRSSGKGCITTSCNKNSTTYRIGYD